MAILNRLTQEEIKKDFTHYALFLGIVPVYIASKEDPYVAARNWIPEWNISVVAHTFSVFFRLCHMLNINVYPEFSFTITGEIK